MTTNEQVSYRLKLARGFLNEARQLAGEIVQGVQS